MSWNFLGTSAFRLQHIATQLEETYNTALLDEERLRAQAQGEALFYSLVSAVSPAVTSFAPAARVAIGLVEQLAQVFCAASAPFQAIGFFAFFALLYNF